MLVPHKDGFRRVWMFPRSKRSIPPWQVSLILTLLNDHLRGYSWSGDQETQNKFCKALEGAGLKRAGEQYDRHSGGSRTYLAQLKSLGLLFQRGNNEIWTTLAGEKLTLGETPLEVMQTQLFRYQYPSAYSRSPYIRIHPDLKVKPFLFLLKLCCDPDLAGITYKEMMIPVIYGHNHNCYYLCKEKILHWRNAETKLPFIEDAKDVYTPRGANRAVQDALKDIGDIANTFKNVLVANCLLTEVDGKRHVVPPSMREKVSRELESMDLFIPFDGDSEEKFQRVYGRFDRRKDTRVLINKPADKEKVLGSQIITARFYEYCGNNVVTDIPDEFVENLHADLGFDRRQIVETITPILKRSLDVYEATYLNLSTGGTSAGISFEKATEKIFRDRLHFSTVHTGQKRRGGIGGYADILVIPLDDGKCGIIDTKASGQYALGAPDYRAMLNDYTKNYKEIDEARNRDLEFCAYIAGGFMDNIDERLVTLSREAHVPASAITAYDLLSLVKRNPPAEKQKEIRRSFSRSGLINYRLLEKI